MTQLVFADPKHPGGGCIFADPTEISSAYEPSCPVVFLSPKHPNGGCIFSDPRTWVVPQAPGGDWEARILREDEEIMAVIMAATEVLH